MTKLNRLQKFVARLFRIVPFDIDQALRHQLHIGIGIGLKQNKIYQIEPPNVWIDEIKQKQVQMQMSTYEPPERTTDPFKAMPPGTLARAHHRMVQHKIHLSGAIPREDRFLIDDNPTREVDAWREEKQA